MGSYEGSCAITGVGIKQGEQVFCVVARVKSRLSPYDINQRLIGLLEAKANMNSQYYINRRAEQWQERGREQGEDRSLFVLAEEVAEFLADDYAAILEGANEEISATWGVYNGYGWLENSSINDGYSYPGFFMVKRNVVEHIAKHAGADLEDLYAVLKAVCVFMLFCRINPFYVVGGSQDFDELEAAAHVRRIAYIQEALAVRNRELQERAL